MPNCDDVCSGVFDTIFAADCRAGFPTVSAWGRAVLTGLLWAVAGFFFGWKRIAVGHGGFRL